ncbi:MAG: DUF692 family multinuclear iron-containing protein, partial [Chloroflexota bacterium]
IEQYQSILDSVDFVEISIEQYCEVPGMPHSQVILHNERLRWSLADPEAIDERWIASVRDCIGETGSPWFSVHLGFASEAVRFEDHMLPESEPLDREALLKRFTENLTRARDACPVPLIVENLDYCPEGAYEHVCEPQFIRSIAEAAGVGLLLDIGHLQVSASWLGFDVFEALDVMPLDRVCEIHISSPRPLDGHGTKLDDVHERLQQRDLDILTGVLSRTTPAAITLEYRRNPELILEELGSIQAILNK